MNRRRPEFYLENRTDGFIRILDESLGFWRFKAEQTGNEAPPPGGVKVHAIGGCQGHLI